MLNDVRLFLKKRWQEKQGWEIVACVRFRGETAGGTANNVDVKMRNCWNQ